MRFSECRRTRPNPRIKKAFRRRARELHPDVNKAADAEDQFKELNEAYDVLSDPNKRAQYDRFGTIPGAAGGGYGGGSGYVDFDDLFGGGFGGMGDIFSSFFGGQGGQGGRPARKEGRDMGVGLRITLEEVACGVEKEIVYDRLAPCPDCKGTGLGENGKVVTCPECGGKGRVVSVQRTFLGDMQTATTCKKCNGTGSSIENPCPECEGQGRVPDRQRVTVKVPAGIRDGQQLRVGGFGEAGIQGAQAGDLIVTCRVQPHEFFERDGDDLHGRANISFIQAILGAEIENRRHHARREGAGPYPRGLPKRAGRSRKGLRHAAPEERYPRQYVRPRERRHPREDYKEAARAAREARGRDGRRGGSSPKPVAKAARRLQLAHLKGKVAKTHVTATFLP